MVAGGDCAFASSPGQHTVRPEFAIIALAAGLAISSAARADDPPERRLACQEESRRNIRGPRRIDLDLYKRVIERRQLYIQDCMTNGLRDVEQTGSISVPIPPNRPSTSR